jgi:hypothetical protein
MYFVFVDSGKDVRGAKRQKQLVWVAIFPVTIEMAIQQINQGEQEDNEKSLSSAAPSKDMTRIWMISLSCGLMS